MTTPISEYNYMAFTETYRSFVASMCKNPVEIQPTPQAMHIWHMVTGLVGELQELLDAQQENYLTDEDFLAAVTAEMGDAVFYVVGIFDKTYGLPVTPDDWMQAVTTYSDPDARGFKSVAATMQAIRSESCRLLNIVKKTAVSNKPLETDKVRDMALDILNGLVEIAAHSFGIPPRDLLQYNMDKLIRRHGGARYDEVSAQTHDST